MQNNRIQTYSGYGQPREYDGIPLPKGLDAARLQQITKYNGIVQEYGGSLELGAKLLEQRAEVMQESYASGLKAVQAYLQVHEVRINTLEDLWNCYRELFDNHLAVFDWGHSPRQADGSDLTFGQRHAGFFCAVLANASASVRTELREWLVRPPIILELKEFWPDGPKIKLHACAMGAISKCANDFSGFAAKVQRGEIK